MTGYAQFEVDLNTGTVLVNYSYDNGINLESIINEDGDEITEDLSHQELRILEYRAAQHYRDNLDECGFNYYMGE